VTFTLAGLSGDKMSTVLAIDDDRVYRGANRLAAGVAARAGRGTDIVHVRC
jgi:hypothetical protein